MGTQGRSSYQAMVSLSHWILLRWFYFIMYFKNSALWIVLPRVLIVPQSSGTQCSVLQIQVTVYFSVSDENQTSPYFCFQPQIGAYYGAEICVVDLNMDRFTDLLLVSAPLHNEGDQEGRVFIYSFTTSGFQVMSKQKSLTNKSYWKYPFHITEASA